MVELHTVDAEQKKMLFNIIQKYLYEMTNYYDDDMDGEGNYSYKYFDDYFTEKTRKAMFIMIDNKPVGFMLLNNYSYLQKPVDHVIAEFSIFPMYRKKGIAKSAVELLFSKYHGKWELKFNLSNIQAKKFWTKATAKFKPIVYELGNNEEVFAFQTMNS